MRNASVGNLGIGKFCAPPPTLLTSSSSWARSRANSSDDDIALALDYSDGANGPCMGRRAHARARGGGVFG
jgi:hypothetical protein